MVRYFAKFFAVFLIFQSSLASFDAVYFDGLDKALGAKGVPDYLLPSQRSSIIQRIHNTKKFGNFSSYPPENILIAPYESMPQDYITFFMLSLFPRSEEFLAPNQIPTDPISGLTFNEVGKIMRLIDDRRTLPTSLQEWREKIAHSLNFNLQAPELKKLLLKDFCYQDKLYTTYCFALESAQNEIVIDVMHTLGDDNENTKYSTLLRTIYPSLFDKGFLKIGDIEKSKKVYATYRKEWPLYRKKRFIEVLAQALVETPSNTQIIQEGLAAFFWRRITALENVKEFYKSYLNLKILGISDSIFAIPFRDLLYEKIVHNISEHPSFYYSLSPEQRYFFTHKTKKSTFTSLAYGRATVSTEEGNVGFSDCVETAVFSLLLHINSILDSNSFLPKGPAQTYFESLSKKNNILSEEEERNKRATLLSNHPTLEYCKKKGETSYELRSSLTNILNTLSYLLGDSSREEKISTVQANYVLQKLTSLISSSTPIHLKIERDLEDKIEFYAHEVLRGFLTIETNHAYYKAVPSPALMHINKILSSVSKSEEVLSVAPLINAAENAFTRDQPTQQYIFTEPDNLKKVFHFLKELSSHQKLEFYKSINSADTDLMIILIKFIMENDIENFSYALQMLNEITSLEDDATNSHIISILAPLIQNDKLPSSYINQILEKSPSLFCTYNGPSSANPNILEWALIHNKKDILGHKNENIAELIIYHTEFLNHLDALTEYCKNYPYVTQFKIFSRDYIKLNTLFKLDAEKVLSILPSFPFLHTLFFHYQVDPYGPNEDLYRVTQNLPQTILYFSFEGLRKYCFQPEEIDGFKLKTATFDLGLAEIMKIPSLSTREILLKKRAEFIQNGLNHYQNFAKHFFTYNPKTQLADQSSGLSPMSEEFFRRLVEFLYENKLPYQQFIAIVKNNEGVGVDTEAIYQEFDKKRNEEKTRLSSETAAHF